MVLVHTGPITAGEIPDAVIDAAKIAANAVETAEITDLNVTQAKYADAVVIRATVTISQDGSGLTGGIGYMPFAGDIVACSFVNDSGNNFTGAAIIAVAGPLTVATSTNLVDSTSERITAVVNNTGLAAAAAITLTTGTTAGGGPTYAIVEVQGQLNAVA